MSFGRTAAASLSTLLVACSSRTEQWADTGFVDRVAADASVREGAGRDAAWADGVLSSDATGDVDRWELYCNVPEPGPCCCEPFDIDIRPPDAVATCDFQVTPPGRFRFRAVLVAMEWRGPDGGGPAIPRQDCTTGDEGWMLVSKSPAVVRLCPASCRAFASGQYEAIRVRQGCYAIACPPL